MLTVVTGAAGFVGSHLCEALLADGHEVRGVDCFTDYYDVAVKRANLSTLEADERFTLLELDLRTADLGPVLDGVDLVFHQAGQPGIRLSWSEFDAYSSHNVLATQRLLEASREAPLSRFVYASSSSVYGNSASYPCVEEQLPQPFSPYGVTKLAGEHLCASYAANFGVPTTSLRYFTVYGPRQRPDMAFQRLVQAALDGTPFPLYGDGSAVRDFTYVADVVAANLAAAKADVAPGTLCNVAGGGEARLGDIIDLVGELAGRPVVLDRHPASPGDVTRTGGSIERARDLLGWAPVVSVEDGLRAQIAWQSR